MNLRPTISAPLPWLTFLTGKTFGKSNGRRRRPSILYPLRKLKFTKEGKRFIAVLFLIGLAAINTGNNLLYLVLAMLLSLIIISGLMSEPTLRKLKTTRRLPADIHKDVPVPARLVIENKKRHLSSYSFKVEELPIPGVEAQPVYVVKLDKSAKTTRTVRYTFRKRGPVKLDGFTFKTRFPFGMFLKVKTRRVGDEVLVLPRTRPLSPEEVDECMHPCGTSTLHARGNGTQIFGLRDYTTNDDARYIHWKASARTLGLLRKEFERDAASNVTIVLDNFRDEPLRFEEAVEKAASLASHYIDRGYQVALKTLTGEVPLASGRSQLARILRFLAYVEPVDGDGRLSVRTLAG